MTRDEQEQDYAKKVEALRRSWPDLGPFTRHTVHPMREPLSEHAARMRAPGTPRLCGQLEAESLCFFWDKESGSIKAGLVSAGHIQHAVEQACLRWGSRMPAYVQVRHRSGCVRVAPVACPMDMVWSRSGGFMGLFIRGADDIIWY